MKTVPEGTAAVIQNWLNDISCLLWPKQCISCRESILPDEEGLCSVCWQDLSKSVSQHYCPSCGRTVSPFGIIQGKCGACQDKQYAFDGIIRVGEYESSLRSLILAFKFSEKTELCKRLSAMLVEACRAKSIQDKIEILVPVPLHWKRKLQRGYNQSSLLAQGLRQLKLPVYEDLVRIRYTEQQWNLTPSQRRTNVKGAFTVRKNHHYADKTIGLVDDITTSGATLNECAKTLKNAGALKVYALVLATAHPEK